jgi:hypothetical protein
LPERVPAGLERLRFAGLARRALLLVAAARSPRAAATLAAGTVASLTAGVAAAALLPGDLALDAKLEPVRAGPEALRLAVRPGRLAACRIVAAGVGTAGSAGGRHAAGEDESNEYTAREGRRVAAHLNRVLSSNAACQRYASVGRPGRTTLERGEANGSLGS